MYCYSIAVWRLHVQSWLQASKNIGILNTCTRLWLRESEQVTLESSRVRQTHEEGRRTYRPKRCRNNNKDEDNSPKTLNDNKYHWCISTRMDFAFNVYICIYIYICVCVCVRLCLSLPIYMYIDIYDLIWYFVCIYFFSRSLSQ